jgi:hypothetical protein
VYGLAGHLLGLALRTRPAIDFGNNALRFLNSPLMASAMVFGNVMVFGRRPGFQPDSLRGNHTLGEEERQHALQAQWLGPLYFPAHLASGVTGLLMQGDWHGRGCRCSFLEAGPHSAEPAPWPRLPSTLSG